MVACFTQARRTRITYAGFESEWVETRSGIPQGSPLSPILFLFYISGLLEIFQDPAADVLGFGFVDDTNLVTWSASAEQNCRMLTAAHTRCELWAEEHGAQFAPDKYQLIHFTRRRGHRQNDLKSTVQIGNHQVGVEQKAIKVLGVWLDPKLTWKEHVSHAARKGLAASDALARIATSTWGPSARNTKLLYTAVVRPIMLYGAHEWGMRVDGRPIASAVTTPLAKVQNTCLRRITGGYKRTPRPALERETNTMPISLYMEVNRYQQANRTKAYHVEAEIARTADTIWRRLRTARAPQERPPTSREVTATKAAEIAQEIKEQRQWREEAAARRRLVMGSRWSQQRPLEALNDSACIRDWGRQAWQRKWQAIALENRAWSRARIWRTPWEQDTRKLYAGLSKAEATALFLMRTEVIGLNAWLASVQVPNITPHCPCGWHAQTVRHVLLHCPRHNRVGLVRACNTENWDEILTRPECAQYAARWLVKSGAMAQFKVAAEIAEERIEEWGAFPPAEEW